MVEEDSRDALYAQILDKLRDRTTEELEEILSGLEPSPQLIIPPDLVLTKENQDFHYSFDALQGKYLFQDQGVARKEKFVPITLNSNLIFDKESGILAFHGSGESKSIDSVSSFVYMGRGQVLIRHAGEGGDGSVKVLTPDLEELEGLRSRSLPPDFYPEFFVGSSEKYLAFKKRDRSRLSLFTRDFRKDQYFAENQDYENVGAQAFLPSGILVFIYYEYQEYGPTTVKMTAYDPENMYRGGSQDLEDHDYSISSLGQVSWPENTYRFIVCDKNDHRLMVYNYSKKHWFSYLFAISFGKDLKRLSNDMFVTGFGEIYKDLLVEDANFMKLQEFRADSVSLRYPSRKRIKEAAKRLETPLVSDINEIIVGFCVEFIPT